MLIVFIEYSYVLAEYTKKKSGTSDVIFSAKFNAPELEFICDHDALIHLTLTEGFVLIDNTEASQNESVESSFKCLQALIIRLGSRIKYRQDYGLPIGLASQRTGMNPRLETTPTLTSSSS